MNFILRRWQSGDEKSLAENANNYQVWKNLKDAFPHPYTIADAYEWINIASDSAESFAIEVEGKAVGGIGILLKGDIYRKNAEIGYWLGEPYWGNKIISTAIVDIVNYTFANYDIHRIYAGVFEYNIPSMKVLKKAGFEKEAILKKSLTKEGKLYDEHIYAKYRV